MNSKPNKCVLYRSTKMPAWTAWTILRNRGFSSGRLRTTPIFLVKVDASQSRTSVGTESAWISLSSSSVSSRRLENKTIFTEDITSEWRGTAAMSLRRMTCLKQKIEYVASYMTPLASCTAMFVVAWKDRFVLCFPLSQLKHLFNRAAIDLLAARWIEETMT